MKNFFKGLSISQIVAGALAAVTSFLLSAKIGIAGSVIGVAIGSIVSAVASQIYQNVLKESSKKIQASTPDHGDGGGKATDAQAHPGADDRTRVIGSHPGTTLDVDGSSGLALLARGGQSGKDSDTNGKGPDGVDAGKTDVMTTVSGGANGADGTEGSDQTVAMPSVAGTDKTAVMKPVATGGKAKGQAALRSGKSGTGLLGTDAAQTETQRRNKRIAIIIAVVSALVAVGITAGVIMLATKGQGTDDVVRNIVKSPTTQQQTPRDDSSRNGWGYGDSSNGTNGNGTTKPNDSTGSTTNGGSSNGAGNSGNGNSGSSSTNNGGSGSGNSSTGGSNNSGGNGGSGTSGGANSGTGGSSSGSTSNDGSSNSGSGSNSNTTQGN
ncbi:hypothetical protein PT282_03615 [Bifidobacterium sp. ESL0763]|uniref:hypothetical protein n=1 Tax=Bifidobacterium sp. ESL0763 TaxID=2983227 RepID=UPI0023F66425|nr:hypothetical protein [Bifidobacterium sp. ESL0763]MDF7663755.1 hypothetical protein [Bifidobacterium sp. ESL0763]